jgi:fimbrial chaperone protein
MIAVRSWGKAATVAALLFLGPTVLAASFNVSPVSVTLDAGAQSGVLEFSNTGNERAAIQVTPVDWRQDAQGNDQYTPTESLIAVPPIFELGPGERQLVRLGLLDESAPGTERAFRLFFEELADETMRNGAAVQMRLRIGVPVFVPGAGDGASLIMESLEAGPSKTRVRLANGGDRHVRLLELAVLDAAGIVLVKLPGGYLLPGMRREFTFEGDMQTADRLQLRTDRSGVSQYALSPLP